MHKHGFSLKEDVAGDPWENFVIQTFFPLMRLWSLWCACSSQPLIQEGVKGSGSAKTETNASMINCGEKYSIDTGSHHIWEGIGLPDVMSGNVVSFRGDDFNIFREDKNHSTNKWGLETCIHLCRRVSLVFSLTHWSHTWFRWERVTLLLLPVYLSSSIGVQNLTSNFILTKGITLF